jgi:YVTN family beta-propeller protein
MIPLAIALLLLVTNSAGRDVSFVDPDRGVVARVEVGAAPHGVALGPDGRAWVATAEGVAVVDTRARTRVALVPYRSLIGPPRFGLYRPGGVGIAAAPDGRRVYVAVYRPDETRLEIVDSAQLAVVGSVKVGDRPFDVLVARDGRHVYTIDHEAYTVTVVDADTRSTRAIGVAPLKYGAAAKPHYAALTRDGVLFLPFQGRVLVKLDPDSGRIVTATLTADTHQHGVALSPDGKLLYVVGTGPSGEAAGPPQITVIDVGQLTEIDSIPLKRPHEKIALSPDGRTAYLTGGFPLDGGWDGITVVDLEKRRTREIPVPDRPLGIVVLP